MEVRCLCKSCVDGLTLVISVMSLQVIVVSSSFFIIYVTNAVFKLKSRHHSIYFLHIAKTLVYTCVLYHPHTNAEIKIRSVTRPQINFDNHIIYTDN